MGNDVVEACCAGEVDVDVEWVVVARSAAVESERQARDRRKLLALEGLGRLGGRVRRSRCDLVAHDQHRAEVGDPGAVLVGHLGPFRDELEGAAAFVVDVGDADGKYVNVSPAQAGAR